MIVKKVIATCGIALLLTSCEEDTAWKITEENVGPLTKVTIVSQLKDSFAQVH